MSDFSTLLNRMIETAQKYDKSVWDRKPYHEMLNEAYTKHYIPNINAIVRTNEELDDELRERVRQGFIKMQQNAKDSWRQPIFGIDDNVTHWYPLATKKDGCPKCGHEGNFVRLALTCPEHGAFGGC